MSRSLRGLQRLFRGHSRKGRRCEQRPAVEALEARSLLSVVTAPGAHHRDHLPTPEGLVADRLPGHHVHALARHGSPRAKANAYQQVNLVSDFPLGVEGVNAQVSDPSLLNPWGLVASATSPFWISDQVTGVSTLYSVDQNDVAKKVPLTVTIPSTITQPAHGFTPLTGPTGIVFNGTSDFQIPAPTGTVPALFIFDTLDGTIAGWNPGSSGGSGSAEVVVNAGPTEEFTGLAMASSGGQNYLYTADPRFVPGIDVFNAHFSKVTLAGNFTDPKLPAGFSPYNIQNINGFLFVTYQTPASGGGVVAEFNPDGTFVRQFAANGSRGPLQSPWGLALAPANFGRFSNALLVGNFGDGRINAYNFKTGKFLGQLSDPQRNPIVIPFLWALDFGNGQSAGPTNTLFFTAGIAGQFHGLFGSLQALRP